MSITPELKAQLISDDATKAGDTGSPEVQVAMLTERIQDIAKHLETHDHDFHSRRGLVMMVGKRNRLLRYLARTDPKRYQDVIARLGLRK